MRVDMQSTRRISNSTFGMLCTVPGLVVLVALVLYPVAYNVVISLMRYNNILPTKFIGLRNYLGQFTSADFLVSWKVSFIYSVGCSALTLLVGLLLAHALNRIRRLGAFFRTLVILPWSVPLVLAGLMWKWILDANIGLVNYLLASLGLIRHNIVFLSDPTMALVSGIIATAYVHIPFVTVLLHAGLKNIPPELYEVSEIDGADSMHKLWYLTLPLNKPQIVFSVVVIWMFTFRTPDVFFSLTGGGPGKATYHAGLYLMQLIYRFLDFGKGATVGVLMFLTIIVVILPTIYLTLMKKERRP
jgi:multiple sugar transport system permease protein